MRRKSLPPPPDALSALRAAHGAVPLVPGTEADCCARIQGRLDLASRDDAAAWLDFLRGLGLAEEGPSGFTRVRIEPDDAVLADAFLDGVLGAREVRDVLAATSEALDAATIAERTDHLVTSWERQRHGAEWQAVWQDRTADLLDWLVLLDLAEQTDDGYRVAETD